MAKKIWLLVVGTVFVFLWKIWPQRTFEAHKLPRNLVSFIDEQPVTILNARATVAVAKLTPKVRIASDGPPLPSEWAAILGAFARQKSPISLSFEDSLAITCKSGRKLLTAEDHDRLVKAASENPEFFKRWIHYIVSVVTPEMHAVFVLSNRNEIKPEEGLGAVPLVFEDGEWRLWNDNEDPRLKAILKAIDVFKVGSGTPWVRSN